MKKLHIGESEYELPGTMDEMKLSELIFLSDLVSQEMPIQEVKIKMLLNCIGAHLVKPKSEGFHRLRIGNKTFEFSTEDMTKVSAAFDYLFTAPDKDGRCFLDNRLLTNHYSEIEIDGITFYGPGKALEGTTYDQYIYLQVYDQIKERKPEAIYNWLGCLFLREKGKFNKDELNVEHMKLLPPEAIILCFWYWIGSCRAIADKFPRIFPEVEAGEVQNIYDGQQKLLDYIAKADPAKKQQYKQDELYNILYSLDYLLEIEEEKDTDS